MPLLFSSTGTAEQKRSSVTRALWAWLVILAGAISFYAKTSPARDGAGRDFSNIFAGAVCLLKGWSPYKFGPVHAVLVQRGYVAPPTETWERLLPLYPPPSLVLFTPLAGLSFAAAGTVFYILTVIVCAIVGFRLFIASRFVAGLSTMERGLFLFCVLLAPDFNWALRNFNPVILTIALLLYCCFDEDTNRRWLPAACFALAVLLKPQIAIPFTLPLWVKPTAGKQMLFRAYGLVLAVVVPTLIWCAMHPQLAGWWTDLRANIAVGAAQGNDMSPFERLYPTNPRLNLDYLLGYWIQSPSLDRAMTNVILAACFSVLLLGLVRIRKKFSELDYKLAVGATAAFTLLPVYHRGYDAVILIAAVPWIFETIAAGKKKTVALVSLAVIVSDWVLWQQSLPSKFIGADVLEPPSLWLFVTHRFQALLTFFLVLCFSWLLLKQTASSGALSTEAPPATPA